MKILVFFLLVVPLISISQTIHIKDDKILYEGKSKMNGLSATEIHNRSQAALPSLVSKFDELKDGENQSNRIKARGELKLKTPYSIVRKAHYSIEVIAKDNEYSYRIDSVSIEERVRGKKPETKSSEELLEALEEGGIISMNAEKTLNEIDMRIQKLLALLHNKVKQESTTPSTAKN